MLKRWQCAFYWVLILLIAYAPVWAEGDSGVMNIVFTGNPGDNHSCDTDNASIIDLLSRVSTYILQNRMDLSPYILIDTGNSLTSGCSTTDMERIFRAMDLMQYRAVRIRGAITAEKKEEFIDLIEKYRIPYVSSDFPCKRGVDIEYKGVRFHVSTESSDLSDSALNILITDLPVADTLKLKGWDIVISTSGEYLSLPLGIDSMIVMTPSTGGEIGILKIEYSHSRITGYEFRSVNVTQLMPDALFTSLIEQPWRRP